MRRTVLLLASTALVVLLASGVAWALTLSFAPAKSYPAGDGVGAVSAGDLDGDGDRDLATANWVYADGLSYVSVRLGRGDGTFGAQRRYPAGAVGPVAIESGDLDGDGDMDLVTANQASETVSVFKNNGAGAFAPGRAFDAGSAGAPVDVDRSDLDGDGDEDLALADEDVGDDAGGVAVLLNAGDGTFGTPRGFTTPQTTGEAVLAKDLDGDGDPDLTTADSVRGQVDVWENGGDGSFALGGTYPVYGGQSPPYRVPPRALTEADFDGDGDTDIATANGRSNNVSVLLNAGDGTLGNERVFGTGGSSGDLTRARMNADSRPDLVVTRSAKNVSVLLNTTK